MATKSTSEEDSVAAPVELCSPSQTVVEPMSHRRMAFRPPTEPLSSAGTTDVQKIELSTAECSSGAGFNKMDCEISKFKPSISGTLINEEERHPKKSKTWNYDEVMVFYEGLKQCAKDFDGTMRIMATEKVEKNKEQTENYYFSLLKHVKQSISLDGDSMGDIGRGAKELFITINACEWRRRTNNNQYIPDRMKELIFHGSVVNKIHFFESA
ncbi:hypothetical protein KIN20_025730 [Parelaphostrongylus tenuis]|uniref:Uncharacterized protein n=1 Tax=Parelaphostrongylus tenuis TaxID=148309 RepID=A0AAD5N959_PARTN|nr:hypothetical protein KIN20_025730 [Parelaphostrongylus tenuis]